MVSSKDSKLVHLHKDVHKQIMELRGWDGCLTANDVIANLLDSLDRKLTQEENA